ncbi:serine/threonine-protein phosphatase 2A regulatory subunit B'' subunit alpha-like protein [Corchorus olitorius]|uniref:Serine/threonine-protein phosphatase 2A regulatory subunit B'' subunit alpha-like protein n=1 Tax=Corchorus olitorius TaxID=93759 RepID=A0A1R3K9Q2_9ROSI|nr:serine/threonine-protein phosphatase 2A regulatory subunit B'' subunit alpha-like protein [Corchorus olitorius]
MAPAVVAARCFSYEHFYVMYCEFWELDKPGKTTYQ